MANKTCFVICPIGDEGTLTRERSDSFLDNIIKPVVSEFGYDAIRADQINESGEIPEQIIDQLLNSELVIADLTGHNVNVFYELAIRHATGKAFIQMIEHDNDLPFDVYGIRTIKFSLIIHKVTKAKESLKAYIESLEKDPQVRTPIRRALDISTLRSDDPKDEMLRDIIGKLNDLYDYIMNPSEHGFVMPTPSAGYSGYSGAGLMSLASATVPFVNKSKLAPRKKSQIMGIPTDKTSQIMGVPTDKISQIVGIPMDINSQTNSEPAKNCSDYSKPNK
ncbi:MAG: hypothetical protein HQL10_12415 [Nitrospirae bacterium]|nr:hypothetical protein [Nitrospirota bacterium]